MNDLKVYYSNKAKGCVWSGELRYLDAHLKLPEREGECKYANVACPNGCGKKVVRHSLRIHETEECQCVGTDLKMERMLQTRKALSAKVDALERDSHE